MSMRTMILASAAVLVLAPWASAQDGGSADAPGNQSQTDDAAGSSRDGATGNQANPANDDVNAQDSGRDGAIGNQAQEDDLDDAGQGRVADSPATEDGAQPAAAPEEMIEPAAGTTLSDREFVERVAISNFFQVTSSELARERAEDPQVQSFAEHMIEDHSGASDRFAAARAESGISSAAISEADQAAAVQAHIDGLEALDGAEFDQAYVDLQVRSHEQAVELFRTYAYTGSEDSLREFANEMLPALEGHLEAAQRLDAQS